MRVILQTDGRQELREYKFPDEWSDTVHTILDELVRRAYR